MSEQVPGAVGGVIPKIPRGRTDEFVSGPLFRRSAVADPAAEQRERTIVAFSAGVVTGVVWMLLVLVVADRLIT